MDFKKLLTESNSNLSAHRRKLHSMPELGFQEEKTSQYIQDELTKLGIPISTKYGKTGVVGVIKGGLGEGRSIMIRADIDGLPITEETGLDFASKNGANPKISDQDLLDWHGMIIYLMRLPIPPRA